MNQNQVVERRGVQRRRRSRPRHSAARLEITKRLEVLLEFLEVVRVIIDVASLQERIEFEARELQQLARFVVRQSAGTVALDGERLERLSARIRSMRNIIRQFDRNLHTA